MVPKEKHSAPWGQLLTIWAALSNYRIISKNHSAWVVPLGRWLMMINHDKKWKEHHSNRKGTPSNSRWVLQFQGWPRLVCCKPFIAISWASYDIPWITIDQPATVTPSSWLEGGDGIPFTSHLGATVFAHESNNQHSTVCNKEPRIAQAFCENKLEVESPWRFTSTTEDCVAHNVWSQLTATGNWVVALDDSWLLQVLDLASCGSPVNCGRLMQCSRDRTQNIKQMLQSKFI